MEKSMIQDLDNIRTSIGFKNTFTTSSRDGGYDLRRSKISNLPSYKKSDLSVKLPFVVIFQTIQIQRLSDQIQALRVALKDSERQAFNCQSYQVQIRQLTDQCHQYDIQLLQYREEIEKLNMISQKIYQQLEQWKQKYQNFDPLVNQKYIAKQQQCQNLENEITKWRERYRALERSKDTEFQDLKLAMQSQRKSVLDRQIKECNLKFEAERNYLNGQLKKLQEGCDQRDNQLTRIKFEAEALRIQNQVNLDSSRKLKQSQNKLNKLTEQIVRVNELLRRKQQQVQRKDSNEQYLKQLIRTLQRQKINHQNQAIKVPQLEGAIKQWIVRFSRLQNEHNQTRQIIERIPGLQRNLQGATIQIQRLGMVIKGKMQELNESNNKFQKYRSLYEQSKKSEQKVPGLERKINQMNYEFQRLNDVLKKRLVEVEQAKNRIFSLEKVLRNFQQAQPQKKRIQQEYKRQIRQIDKNKKQINELQRDIKKIPELQAVILDQRNIREEYAVQVQRLNRGIKQKCDQKEILQQKISHLMNKVQQFQNIETELTNYKTQNNRMVQQIDNMNDKIKKKCEEVDQLAELITNLQRNLQEYKLVEQKLIQNIQKTQNIIEELNRTKIELQYTQKNLLQCQCQLNQAKNTILQINNDKQMLNKNLNIRTQQLNHTKEQLNTCIQQIQRLRQIQRKYNLLQEEMRVTQNKLKQTDEYLRKQRARNQQLQYKNQILNAELQKIKVNGYFPEQFRHMFSQLKSTQNQKQRQMQNLLKKQSALQKFAEQIQNIVANVCDTMKIRNNEWSQINKKITDSIQNVQKQQKLQDQLNQLRVENLQLESKIKVLNLQMLEIEAKKATEKQISPNTFSMVSPTSKSAFNSQASSTSSWSFNTVPSKKAIDPVVENQASRTSRVLGNNNNLISGIGLKNQVTSNQGISNSKPKLQQIRNSQHYFNNENIKPNYTNIASSYQFNNTSSTYKSPNPRAPSPSGVSGFVSPIKTSTVYSTANQSTESYYTAKVTKTNSVSEPFTFKTSFRA